jgi:Kef-type K+ transport system membrane component KefB
MKPFVSSDARAFDWNRASDTSSPGTRRGSGGRIGRVSDLYNWMLYLAGLLVLADVFSPVHLWPPVQYLLAGIVLGAFAGRSIVVWRERRMGELHPDLVRGIEHSWTLLGVAVMMLTLLFQAALA